MLCPVTVTLRIMHYAVSLGQKQTQHLGTCRSYNPYSPFQCITSPDTLVLLCLVNILAHKLPANHPEERGAPPM